LKAGLDSTWRDALREQLANQAPFSLLPEYNLRSWISNSNRYRFQPGERLIRPDELNSCLYLIIKGEVRLIATGDQSEGPISLDRRGPGQLLGWASLLRSEPSEYVHASTDVVAIALPAKDFISFIQEFQEFSNYFGRLTNLHEAFCVAVAAVELIAKKPSGWREDLIERIRQARAASLKPGEALCDLPELPPDWRWYLSTPGVPGYPVGALLDLGKEAIPIRPGFLLNYRFIALPDGILKPDPSFSSAYDVDKSNKESGQLVDLYQLGILEEDHLTDDARFPVVSGKGEIPEIMAVCEMISLHQQVPFRRDAIQKVLEDQIRRDKRLSLELIAGLCELLGMSSQLAEVSSEYLSSIDLPAITIIDDLPVIIYAFRRDCISLAHPHRGITTTPIQEIQQRLPEKFRFVLPRRHAATPMNRFGWNWFTPLLTKYRKALILVFISSFLAQAFGLAIPLLLQQIIDKVLMQGNLSSLNILGSAMVVMALFQGILQALRTYIFVDTTDRMDLTLGSSVIDRLLSLPLSFFEKRTVGELSQRIGELNTIRNFLTGTALISVLNLIFAAAYLAVMFLYSPLLSVVALSTFPLYLILVFTVSPIYKNFIRKRAVASARTQSHLIEVIGGIQTVKAQHFELTARWKWQDRYRHFVQEGFKSSALGATAGEIGNFLNQVSGLFVLWVGMSLVLKGEFTLGQLIAFRIISGNVTSPLMQLAGLYQGFQGVQLSMERLSDIIDQNPELSTSEAISQIHLPPICGSVRYENVSFRFANKGSYQVDTVNFSIEAGSFVGIVGQSGSGKSTMMKLLPRLYDSAKGRIYIDEYDISKVDLSSLRRQIGICPQDSLLFEGTIAENIALNDPQSSTEAILESARIACAHDFIMSLDKGYATEIAERGSNLSGGQRQRIAIARTVLSNPSLLVFDEATSALDYDTEKQLCLNLQEWAQNRTVFFITHRLLTIRTCSNIIVMHQGRLVEQGNHESLIAQNGRYAALYRQQESSY